MKVFIIFALLSLIAKSTLGCGCSSSNSDTNLGYTEDTSYSSYSDSGCSSCGTDSNNECDSSNACGSECGSPSSCGCSSGGDVYIRRPDYTCCDSKLGYPSICGSDCSSNCGSDCTSNCGSDCGSNCGCGSNCNSGCGSCTGGSGCDSGNTIPPRCLEPIKPGLCKAYFPRFAYNSKTRTCEQFIYGGCGGNNNNFNTKEECEQVCVL